MVFQPAQSMVKKNGKKGEKVIISGFPGANHSSFLKNHGSF
jgi:hypothetical protein